MNKQKRYAWGGNQPDQLGLAGSRPSSHGWVTCKLQYLVPRHVPRCCCCAVESTVRIMFWGIRWIGWGSNVIGHMRSMLQRKAVKTQGILGSQSARSNWAVATPRKMVISFMSSIAVYATTFGRFLAVNALKTCHEWSVPIQVNSWGFTIKVTQIQSLQVEIINAQHVNG